MLAFAREGYRYSDINLRDLRQFLGFRGMQTLLRKNLGFALKEFYKSLVTEAQIKFLQQYVPTVQSSFVMQGPSGVRALAMGDDGTLLDDFIFETPNQHTLHVRNAPSPAATSSLAIGREVAKKADSVFYK